jgi:hypothetical protein
MFRAEAQISFSEWQAFGNRKRAFRFGACNSGEFCSFPPLAIVAAEKLQNNRAAIQKQIIGVYVPK